MTGTGLTVIARCPQLLLRYAGTLNLDRDELMRTAGLSVEQLADPDARVPLAPMRKLWQATIAQSGDDYLGLNVGRTIRAKEMGLVGYAMHHSADLHGALSNLSRYGRLVSEAVNIVITDSDDGVVIRCRTHSTMAALRHPHEAMLSLVLTIARELTGAAVRPEHVRLPSAAPATPTTYRQLFDASIEFGCTVTEMVFADAQMRLPTKAPDATLRSYLEELADSKIKALGAGTPGLVDRVRHAIWVSLPNKKPDLQAVAASLRMSPRTLQRRLRAAGTSYSEVLDDFRHETAVDLRAKRGVAAADIAFLLGYSESSSFQRAARRWREMSKN